MRIHPVTADPGSDVARVTRNRVPSLLTSKPRSSLRSNSISPNTALGSESEIPSRVPTSTSIRLPSVEWDSRAVFGRGCGTSCTFHVLADSKPVTPTELRDAILLTLGHEDEDTDAPLVTRHRIREAWDTLHILLAEDDRVNQLLATHILERLGHTLCLAETGREALDLLEEEDFDLVLMDIEMPEMDGVEATRQIREREATEGGHIPIVPMTAHALVGDRERFVEAGMDDYISKPISQERLREVVRTVGQASRS